MAISWLIVNPRSVQPVWPLSIRRGGSRVCEVADSPISFIQDFELTDAFVSLSSTTRPF